MSVRSPRDDIRIRFGTDHRDGVYVTPWQKFHTQEGYFCHVAARFGFVAFYRPIEVAEDASELDRARLIATEVELTLAEIRDLQGRISEYLKDPKVSYE